MPTLLVGAVLAVYAASLFLIGWWAQRQGVEKGNNSALLTALSLGVYCTSWTFYGAVGTAARSGWDYLPIYLGPILAFSLGFAVIKRTVSLGKAHGATSLPDLLSRRFGRSPRLAALVTLTLVLVSIPYIALQLLAVSSTFAEVTRTAEPRPGLLIVIVSAVMALFGLVFGTRNRDVTHANPGLVGAMALESIFKLIAFAAVAIVALMILNGTERSAVIPPLLSETSSFAPDRFFVLTVLAAFMVVCLPRQFHMMVVEPRSVHVVKRSVPLIIAYLAAFAILALPVAAAGQVLRLTGSPDLYVLAIPAARNLSVLEVAAFAGGFAAASGMIIVAGVALSTMLASDVLLPLLSRGRGRHVFRHALFVRRISLVILLALAAIFALAVPRGANLADLGVVAFAGAGQVAPLLLAALYVPRVNEKAAIFGLLAGVLGWIFFVLGPAFFVGTFVDGSPLSEMLAFPLSDAFTRGTVLALAFNVLAIAIVSFSQPFTLEARQEAARFGTVDPGIVLDGVVRLGDLRALLVQILGPHEASSLMSEWADNPDTHFAPPDLIAAAEAKLSGVLGNASAHILMTQLLASGKLAAGDVMVLMGHASRELRFSQELLATTLENLAEGVSVIDGQGRLVAWNRAYTNLFQYPPSLLQVGAHVEDLLRHNLPSLSDQGVQKRVAFLAAGHAHTSETTLNDGRILRLQGRPVPGGGYVTSFSDVTEYRNSQKALADSEKATRFYTENIPFPIAFCDNQQAIRFHNKAYAKMAGRPDMDLTGALLTDLHGHLFQLRQPHVDAVLSGSGQQRFVLTPSDIGGSITWQVTYVPQLAFDGTVLGFFGFYQDISKRRQAQAALEEANRTLEERVKLRTEELQSANHSAQLARREAENANQSKTRFLAAASHDVLQPLNAARLFASSLEDSLPTDSQEAATAKKIGMAIVSADTLLRSLLNLSKLEAGGVDPKFVDLELGPFLRSIVEEFRPMAIEKGLDLKLVETSVAIRTDAGLLRSALQNLISNALRYTDEGRVLIGVRRGQDTVLVQVVDTGRGLSEEEIPSIFRAFSRLKRDVDVDGAGLGLATVKRVADLLDHPIDVISNLEKGTTFSLAAPRVLASRKPTINTVRQQTELRGAQVVCVDNDPVVLEAMKQRFESWNATTEAYDSVHSVRQAYRPGARSPDLLVLDYQLDDEETGLDVVSFFRNEMGVNCPALIVTASRSEEMDQAVTRAGVPFLLKPVEPAALRALSVNLLSKR